MTERRRLAVPGVVLCFVLLAPAMASPQQTLPDFLKFARVPGVEVRWVDFAWNPEGFAAMEAGAKHPAAGRSWMVALLQLNNSMKWEGKWVPAGAALLVLNPRHGESPMSLELRYIDMREVGVSFSANVIGVPPEGERYNLLPAGFETVPETKERLELAIAMDGKDAVLTIHFGNRKTSLRLTGRY
jgi:hypothetical protein